MSKDPKTLSDLKRELGLIVNKVYGLGYKSGREKAEEEALYQKYRGDSLSRMEGFNEGVEKGRKLGQDEAWSLARRVLVEDFSPSEYVALKNSLQLGGDVAIEKRIITRGSYAEVAAMVAEWEENKSEEEKKKTKTRAEAFFEKFPEAIRLESEGVNPKGCVSSASILFGKEVNCVVDAKYQVDCEKCWSLPYGGEFEVSKPTREVDDQNGLVSGEDRVGGVSS